MTVKYISPLHIHLFLLYLIVKVLVSLAYAGIPLAMQEEFATQAFLRGYKKRNGFVNYVLMTSHSYGCCKPASSHGV